MITLFESKETEPETKSETESFGEDKLARWSKRAMVWRKFAWENLYPQIILRTS